MTILGNTEKDKIWREKTGGLGWLPLLLSTQKAGMVVGMEELSGKEIYFLISRSFSEAGGSEVQQ